MNYAELKEGIDAFRRLLDRRRNNLAAEQATLNAAETFLCQASALFKAQAGPPKARTEPTR